MGYDTRFDGEFRVSPPVSGATFLLLRALADYESAMEKPELFPMGKSMPKTYCQWKIQDDHKTIRFDGGEKFYEYVAWIKYIVQEILSQRGHMVNGNVVWSGEDPFDAGEIIIEDNAVTTRKISAGAPKGCPRCGYHE